MKTLSINNSLRHSEFTVKENIEKDKNANVSRKVIKINSLMFTLIIMANLISLGFAAFGIVEEGLIPIIFVSALVISYTVTVLNNPNNIRVNLKTLALVSLVLIFFMFSLLFRGTESVGYDYFIEFLAYGVITYLMTLVPFSPTYIIRYSMFMGILFIINPDALINLAAKEYSAYNSLEMGSSYAILPSVIAAVIHFSFFRNCRNILNLIAYIANIILLWLLFTEATRGAALSILILFCFIFYMKFMQKSIFKKRLLLPIVIFFTSTISIIILLNFEKILYWLYYSLQSIGIEIAMIQKTYVKMANEGFIGVLNGRDAIYENALLMFYNSPIIGNGIGVYADVYGNWPHNLFLQLLIEGGLILFIPFLFIFLYCLIILLKPWSFDNELNEIKLLLLFLFVTCIPRLMLSSYLWKQQTFWLMIFICISILIKNKRKILNKNSNPNPIKITD